MAIEGTVKVPLAGRVSKKTAIMAGIGVGAVGLILFIRQRKASSSSPAATAASGQIDPATGYAYGSPEDQAALAAAQGAGQPYNTSGLGSGGLGGYYYGPGGSTQSTPPGPGNFADNAEWAQYAESYMIGTLQADANSVGNALGKYITGQPVDASQQTLIEEAIAIAGYPPTAGPGGHPPNINRGSSKPPPGQTVPVPRITGYPAGEAFNVIRAAQLTPHEDSASIRPDWTVTSQSPRAGTQVAAGSKVSYQAKASSGGGGGHHCPVGMHWDAALGKCVSDTRPPHPPPGTKVRVPNVVGQSQENAIDNLADAGLKGTGQRPVHGRVRIVTGESPKAGTSVARGATVRLTTRLT